MFCNKNAYFSESVEKKFINLWRFNGGKVSKFSDSQYLFINPFDSLDIKRFQKYVWNEHSKLGYVERYLLHPTYIAECLKNKSANVNIYKYSISRFSLYKEKENLSLEKMLNSKVLNETDQSVFLNNMFFTFAYQSLCFQALSMNKFLSENETNIFKNIFPIKTILPSMGQEKSTILDICNMSSNTNSSKYHSATQPYSSKKIWEKSVNMNRSDIYQFNSSNEQDVKDFSNDISSQDKKIKKLKKERNGNDCKYVYNANNSYVSVKQGICEKNHLKHSHYSKKRKTELENDLIKSVNYKPLNLNSGSEGKIQVARLNKNQIKNTDYSTDEEYAKMVKEKLESSIRKKLEQRKSLNPIDQNTVTHKNKKNVINSYKRSHDKEIQTSETEEFSNSVFLDDQSTLQSPNTSCSIS